MSELPDIVAVMVSVSVEGPYSYRVSAGMRVERGSIVAVPLVGRPTLGVVWGVPKGNYALLVTDAYYVRQPTRWRRRKSFQPMRDVLTGGRRFLVIFVLLPQVNPRKRFDVDAAANRWADRVDELVARYWRS